MTGKIRVAVNGSGVIGKRVADAVALRERMSQMQQRVAEMQKRMTEMMGHPPSAAPRGAAPEKQ